MSRTTRYDLFIPGRTRPTNAGMRSDPCICASYIWYLHAILQLAPRLLVCAFISRPIFSPSCYNNLNTDVACLLLNNLDEVLVDLGELLVTLDLLGRLGSSALLGDHDDGCWALGVASSTELSAGVDEDVWDVVVLAEDWDVGDDVHWGDVGSEDNNTASSGIGCPLWGLAESLDDLFDSTL